jgi:phasin family protein
MDTQKASLSMKHCAIYCGAARLSITRIIMFAFSKQLSFAAIAVFDAQLVTANAFAQAVFDSGVTLIDLNVDATRTCMAATTVAANQLLSVRDPQEWLNLVATQSRLALDRAQAYGRQAADIAQGAHAKYSRVAETEIAASQQKVVELVDVVKKAPAVAVKPLNTFLKTTLQTAHAAYDQMTPLADGVSGRGGQASV